MPRFKLHLFLVILLPLCAVAEISVTARFNPPRIALGDRSQYLVEIRETSGTGTPSVGRVTSLPIPESGGLELKNGRTSSSQQTNIFNGNAEYSVTQSLIIDAQAQSEGTYRIPSYAFEYKGQRLEAPEARLEVVARDADAGPTRDELIFLRADLPDELYIGQKITFQLRLYIDESVSLDGLNGFDRRADGFTSSELPDDPKQGTQILNGRQYRILSWPMTLTPIQTGPQGLSFELSVSARLPSKNNRDPFGRSPFGRSMFDDFFGRSEQFNVYNDTEGINILPLPIEEQPDSFSGAIGDFSIAVTSDSQQGKVGEPIMLSLELNGSGNFDRINGPKLPESAAWRSYEPESKFETSDEMELRGSKRFDYVLIPQLPGQLELPEVAFSYFNPASKSYVTLDSPALKIQVEPSINIPQVAQSGPAPQQPSGEPIDLSRSLTTEEALTTLDYQPTSGRKVETLRASDPAFLTKSISLAAGIIIGCLILHLRKRKQNDPLFQLRRAARAQAKEALNNARSANSSGETDTFYKEAQLAVRQSITASTGQNCTAGGVDQLADYLKNHGVSHQTITDLHALFREADAFRFGGNRADVHHAAT